MFEALAEADAWVQDQPLTANTSSQAGLDALLQECASLPLLRRRNEGPAASSGAALACASGTRLRRCGRQLRGRPAPKRTNIIDQTCPRSDGRRHDGGLAGVDGNGHGGASSERFDHRDDAANLFCFADIGRAGSCGLAAYIDHSRARLDHALRVLDQPATASTNLPPSEKESGVTLRMPITMRLGQIERVAAAAQLHGCVRCLKRKEARCRASLDSSPVGESIQCWLAGLPIGASPFSRSRPLPPPLPPNGVALSSQPAGGLGSRPSMMSLI